MCLYTKIDFSLNMVGVALDQRRPLVGTLDTGVSGFFNSLETNQKRAFSQSLIDELNGLFGLKLPSIIGAPADYLNLLKGISEVTLQATQYKAKFDKGLTLELITRLSPDKKVPIPTLIDSVAQILMNEELDYTKETYSMERFSLEYAVRARRIDRVFDELVKPYCGHSCTLTPKEIGCCDSSDHALNGTPDYLVGLQEIEAKRNKVSLEDKEGVCRYHTGKGCNITLFKTPLCLGHICPELEDNLWGASTSREHVANFLGCLNVFGAEYLLNQDVLQYMDAVIETGNALLSSE
jgi:hypothetical protein